MTSSRSPPPACRPAVLRDPGRTARRRSRGMRVGPFRLVREVGQGGMGTVYLAERDGTSGSGSRSSLIRPGFHLDQRLIARFLRSGSSLPGWSTRDRAAPRRRGDGRRRALVRDGVRGRRADGPGTAIPPSLLEARLELLGQAVRCRGVRAPAARRAPGPQALEHPRHRGPAKLLDFGIAKLLSAEDDTGTDLTAAGLRLSPPSTRTRADPRRRGQAGERRLFARGRSLRAPGGGPPARGR